MAKYGMLKKINNGTVYVSYETWEAASSFLNSTVMTRGDLVMTRRPDNRALTVYCWADGSGFGWKAPGAAAFPQTGYFDESPLLTVDVDVEGKIIDVGFALDSKNGTLENDIQCSIDRHCEDEWMVWGLLFRKGAF